MHPSIHSLIRCHALFTSLVLITPITQGAAETHYDARVQHGEILTPKPKNSPVINGPKVYGCRPQKKFVYRIPCQGIRPIHFSVEGLPDGMVLDSEKGVIRGITPEEKGTYELVFKAKNSHGEDSSRLRLIVGNKISLTPPVGYSSWGGHMLDIDQKTVRKALDVFVNQGMADAGFQYICIDDGWGRIDPDIYAGNLDGFSESGFNTEEARKWSLTQFRRMGDFDPKTVVRQTRDKDRRPIPNHHFPDIKGMVDEIHAEGLKAGIYSSPGIVTCQIQMGSFGHEAIDAKQFADWGFDFIKYDRCGIKFRVYKAKAEGEEYGIDKLWRTMTEEIDKQDRDIIFNLCQYGVDEPWTWAPEMGIESWRIGGDLNHNPGNYFEQAMRILKPLRLYSKPGQWNDPDFMYIHKIKNVESKGAPSQEILLSTNQRYQYVTLWAMVCAPFFFSSDINELDEFSIRLLSNAELINIHQDELGEVAHIIDEKEDLLILSKTLVDGAKAIGVFNRSEEKENSIQLDWKQLGIAKPKSVRDVWRQMDLPSDANGLNVRLSPSGCAVFLVHGQ